MTVKEEIYKHLKGKSIHDKNALQCVAWLLAMNNNKRRNNDVKKR